jgi:hypothetical protein
MATALNDMMRRTASAAMIPRADRSSIARLALDFGRPAQVVERLYLSELAGLERQARIRRYLPLLALRRVREALRDGAYEQGDASRVL